jgi:hypothetical protein
MSRAKALLDQYYDIAEEMTRKAHEIVMSGEDTRSNDDRPGVSTLMHTAAKAIDEIVRLTPLSGIDSVESYENRYIIEFMDTADGEEVSA